METVVVSASPDGSTAQRRVLVQELRVTGSPGAAVRNLPAVASAWWVEPASGSRTPAWGPVDAEVSRDDAMLAPKLESLLARTAWGESPGDIRSIWLGEAPVSPADSSSEEAPTTPPRFALERTVEGWKGGVPGSPQALGPDDQAGVAALLALLCDTPAAAVLLTRPQGCHDRWTASLVVGGSAAQTATIGSAMLPGAGQDAVVIRSGAVWRVYPAATARPVTEWLKAKVPVEG
jgi:hypothetical protein